MRSGTSTNPLRWSTVGNLLSSSYICKHIIYGLRTTPVAGAHKQGRRQHRHAHEEAHRADHQDSVDAAQDLQPLSAIEWFPPACVARTDRKRLFSVRTSSSRGVRRLPTIVLYSSSEVKPQQQRQQHHERSESSPKQTAPQTAVRRMTSMHTKRPQKKTTAVRMYILLSSPRTDQQS